MHVSCSEVLYNISFKKHPPEDGHNMWPKLVAGNAVYNTINVHISLYALIGSVSCNESLGNGHKSFKVF